MVNNSMEVGFTLSSFISFNEIAIYSLHFMFAMVLKVQQKQKVIDKLMHKCNKIQGSSRRSSGSSKPKAEKIKELNVSYTFIKTN